MLLIHFYFPPQRGLVTVKRSVCSCALDFFYNTWWVTLVCVVYTYGHMYNISILHLKPFLHFSIVSSSLWIKECQTLSNRNNNQQSIIHYDVWTIIFCTHAPPILTWTYATSSGEVITRCPHTSFQFTILTSKWYLLSFFFKSQTPRWLFPKHCLK